MKKYIHLNLKRFDISDSYGGVNHDANAGCWGSKIIHAIQPLLRTVKEKADVDFTVYFPEAHIIPASQAQEENSPINIGCQSVYREDVSAGGNFGAFTSNRTAASMKQLGVTDTIIGHCEERRDKLGILERAGIANPNDVNQILNEEIKMANKQGMRVLYCIGESEEEKGNWQKVLEQQITIGLANIPKEDILIAYEPVWAIGPGKVPPKAEEIKETVDFIKSIIPNVPVIYGGGLKKENAKELAQIDSLDGGLIALTRFTDDIGFYPEEYIEIIEEFLESGRLSLQ